MYPDYVHLLTCIAYTTGPDKRSGLCVLYCIFVSGVCLIRGLVYVLPLSRALKFFSGWKDNTCTDCTDNTCVLHLQLQEEQPFVSSACTESNSRTIRFRSLSSSFDGLPNRVITTCQLNTVWLRIERMYLHMSLKAVSLCIPPSVFPGYLSPSTAESSRQPCESQHTTNK